MTRAVEIEPSTIKVWCLVRDQFSHIRPVEQYFGEQADFIYDTELDPDRLLAEKPDIVLCVNDFPYDIARCLMAAREAHIPSIVLQDGILEWRCQYENPLFGTGGGAPQHQPVIADKIACIGRQSARQIAAWGNVAKVEVTGMPRLDYLAERQFLPRQSPGTRVLVMTAKKPGFTPEQTEVTLQSLRDTKNYLDEHPEISVTWRITKKLDRALGVENQLRELSSPDLVEVLEHVDAVITTPSTAMLEAMLLDRPVACLDYHNVPRFVPTAWTISSKEQIGNIVAEILCPPETKMVYQRDALADSLRLGRAAPNVAELITRLVQHFRSVEGDVHCVAPPDMLGCNATNVNAAVDLASLYPEHELFQETDIEDLRLLLARLQKENERLNARLRTRDLSYWLSRLGVYLAKKVRS